MRAVVVALGQAAAGDDGVGFAVLDEIERRGVPHDARLVRARDPMDVLPLFEDGASVVLVDAVLASPPGAVVELGLDDLSRKSAQPASSHGMGAAQVVELARALAATSGQVPEVRVVAVTIDRPDRYHVGLSPEVLVAVPDAADRVLSLLRG
jgi:hydrogenase maturation protease